MLLTALGVVYFSTLPTAHVHGWVHRHPEFISAGFAAVGWVRCHLCTFRFWVLRIVHGWVHRHHEFISAGLPVAMLVATTTLLFAQYIENNSLIHHGDRPIRMSPRTSPWTAWVYGFTRTSPWTKSAQCYGIMRTSPWTAWVYGSTRTSPWTT